MNLDKNEKKNKTNKTKFMNLSRIIEIFTFIFVISHKSELGTHWFVENLIFVVAFVAGLY